MEHNEGFQATNRQEETGKKRGWDEGFDPHESGNSPDSLPSDWESFVPEKLSPEAEQAMLNKQIFMIDRMANSIVGAVTNNDVSTKKEDLQAGFLKHVLAFKDNSQVSKIEDAIANSIKKGSWSNSRVAPEFKKTLLSAFEGAKTQARPQSVANVEELSQSMRETHVGLGDFTQKYSQQDIVVKALAHSIVSTVTSNAKENYATKKQTISGVERITEGPTKNPELWKSLVGLNDQYVQNLETGFAKYCGFYPNNSQIHTAMIDEIKRGSWRNKNASQEEQHLNAQVLPGFNGAVSRVQVQRIREKSMTPDRESSKTPESESRKVKPRLTTR